MAGKEVGGIEHADADLFRDAVWLDHAGGSRSAVNLCDSWNISELLQAMGVLRDKPMDAERHDRLCAWISHLPQMIATALASALREELGDEEAATQIGGRALREMTRIAHSPYSMWRDIALTKLTEH